MTSAIQIPRGTFDENDLRKSTGFITLKDNMWLSDDIIDAYMNLVVASSSTVAATLLKYDSYETCSNDLKSLFDVLGYEECFKLLYGGTLVRKSRGGRWIGAPELH